MKIKCPACQAVLNIPESAAGKVVKCPCGKQLRAPGGAPTTGQPAAKPGSPTAGSPARPAPAKPATAGRPNVTRPAAARPAAAAGGFDAGMLDELTDQDLQPVNVVGAPGGPYAPPGSPSSAGSRLLQEHASEDVRKTGTTAKGKRPGLLTFLGVVNVFWALGFFGIGLVMLGLMAFLPQLAEEDPDLSGGILLLVAGGAFFMSLLSLSTTIACFVNKPICWYIMLFSYAYGFADRIFTVVEQFMENEPMEKIGGGSLGVAVGLMFWVFMHSAEVKAYYGTTKASLGGLIAADIAGLLIGCVVTGAIVFLV